jgi:IclR family acetate operon transcriptional repressor
MPADKATDDRAQGSVRAVDRALDILLAFRPEDDALTVGELLKRVDLSRATLYRLIHTLELKQFLIASGDPQRFRLGPSVAQLAHAWGARLDLGAVAEPMMRKVWQETGETVALFVHEGAYRVCIAEMPSAQALSYRRGVGYREKLGLGASGRAILAQMGDAVHETGTSDMKSDIKKYRRELDLIRDRGYAVSKNELIQGAVAVAAPFFNGAGRVSGAMGVFGPTARLSDAQIAKFGKLLVREAAQFSKALGTQ